MEPGIRIDAAVSMALTQVQGMGGPPLLNEAVRYAVLPGGARVRPRLCLAVASACAESHPMATDGAAAAIELIHCASLVHDDMPCFDNADLRRGKPSVHKAYGERIALLTGDALIVLAFEILARRALAVPERLAGMVSILSRSAGMPAGIVAGQAWECETDVDLEIYQRQKTGALFSGATMLGAAAAGSATEPWRALGQGIGEAFQIADDILDAASTEDQIGKPVGQDEALDRPSAVRELGLSGALGKLQQLVDDAIDSVPDCPGRDGLIGQVRAQAERLVPARIMSMAA